MKEIYLIQGVLFQENKIIGIGYGPTGTMLKIHKALMFAMYYGIVGTSENKITGSMSDHWGESEISNFCLTNKKLKFMKQYQGRPPIFYSFTKKEGNTWIGKYKGKDCGKGNSKCIITPVDDSFLEAPSEMLSATKQKVKK